VSKHTAYHGEFSNISVDWTGRVKLLHYQQQLLYTAKEVPSKWQVQPVFASAEYQLMIVGTAPKVRINTAIEVQIDRAAEVRIDTATKVRINTAAAEVRINQSRYDTAVKVLRIDIDAEVQINTVTEVLRIDIASSRGTMDQ
jgi:hypothetical protein